MLYRSIASLVLLASSALAQDASSQIRAEVQRLRQSLQADPIRDPQFAGNLASTESLLKAADDGVAAGRLYFALERLIAASDFVQGARIAIAKTDAVKGKLPAFEEEWRSASSALAARDQELQRVDWSHTPAAIRALSEAARTRSGPLLEGGHGFAVSTKPEDGLFYVGEALAQADFAKFCAGLHYPRTARPMALRSFLPELLALQEKANAAFQPPRSIDSHPRFIALNSTIKLARELDASKSYAGALFQYLESVRHYGMLFMPALDAAKQTAMKQALAEAQTKLDASKDDDSILQIMLQRSASQVARADGSAPTEDEWKSAQVTVDQVIPAYFAARKAPATMHKTSTKTVDLTLVRWPYT